MVEHVYQKVIHINNLFKLATILSEHLMQFSAATVALWNRILCEAALNPFAR